MRLSMSVLADELKKLQAEAELHAPSMTIERARIAEPSRMHPEQADSTAWITMDESNGCVLVTCGEDRIRTACSSVSEVSELIQSAFEKYTSWYESLLSNVMDETLAEIAASSADILRARFTVADLNTLSVVCSAGPADDTGMSVLASAVQDGLLRLPVLNAIERGADCVFSSQDCRLCRIGAEAFALLPVQSAYGQYLLMAEGSGLSRGILFLCTYLVQIINIWARLHPSEQTENILRQMLTGQTVSPEKAWYYLGQFGIQRSELYVIYDMLIAAEDSMPAAALAAWLNQQPHQGTIHAWVCPGSAEEVILMFSGTIEEKLQWDRTLTEYLAELPVVCGMSGGDDDLSHFSMRYQCAGLAAKFSSDSHERIKSYESAFLNTVKTLCEEKQLLTMLPSLRFLKEMDQKTGSDFYRTLRVFYLNHENQSLTAKKLFISRTALQRRLKAIRELLTIDLTKTEYRLALELSYYLTEGELTEEELTEEELTEEELTEEELTGDNISEKGTI